MHKIKIMTDSASDISKEYEEKHNIKIICFPITVNGRDLHDRDLPMQEYYELIINSPDLPKHSQITSIQFEEYFKEYYEQGYDEIFYISIASKGSNTYNSARMGRDQFYDNNPDAKGKLNIRIIDSGNYSGTYGYPVVQAAIKAENGTSPDEIEGYLKEWFSCCEVHLGCYTLEFVKKSGRVSSAAGFVGEVLGLRPVIKIKDGISSVTAKVRGDKAVVPKIADITCERIIPQSPYVLMVGYDPKFTDDLEKELTKRLGYPPEMRFQIGGAVSANCGPKTVAVAFKAKSE